MWIPQLPREMHLLPGRFGPRPRTTDGLPFRQLDQLADPEIARRLTGFCLELPNVRVREARTAVAGTLALAVPDRLGAGPEQAFIDGREFCHLHPEPHGSVHLTLPAPEVEGFVALGWAERHPISRLGIMRSLVLVYAPRTADEVHVVLTLVEHSRRFAMGKVGKAATLKPATLPTL